MEELGASEANNYNWSQVLQCTEVRFASFLAGDFTATAVIDPPES